MILLCGDMNSRTSTNVDYVIDDNNVHMPMLPDDYIVDTNLVPRCSQDKGHTNNNGLLLLDLCKQSSLRILNGRFGEDKGLGRYTFVGSRGSSVVDYVLSSQNLLSYIDKFVVGEPNIMSDHCLVSFSLNFCTKNINTTDSDKNNSANEHVKHKYVWDRDKLPQFNCELNSQDVQEQLFCLNEKITDCLNDNDIDNCLSDFNNIVEKVSNPLFKKNINVAYNTSNLNKCDNPWYTDECHKSKLYFLQMLDKYRESKTDNNRVNMVNARSVYKYVIRKSKTEYDRNKTKTFTEAKYKNAKLYWRMLKESANIKSNNIPLNTFEQYFKAVNNPNDHFFNADEDVLYFNERYEQHEFNVMFDELNILFTDHEIIKSINQLKTNRSAGPDLLLNEFFIYGKNELTPTICRLFNKLFEIGYFPASWSEGYIIPLHKKGSINDVENYRGITLLSCLGKLFSRVLNNRLSDWAEKYNVLIEAQAGFRAHMSTVDNIFALQGLIAHILNQGKKLFCVFVDFSKAFDYVVRDNLWYKLIQLGIRGNILNIIKSMYEGVKSRVKHTNVLSDEMPCALGVRQGECLSPLLFSMFLNDIENEYLRSGVTGLDINMFKIFMLLYADDIVIFANSAEELQENINLLSKYCNRWKMKVNTKKTKVMVFRKGGILPRNLMFFFDENIIDIVSKFNYLGMVFTSGGSVTEAQTTLAGQAQKAIFKLNKYLYKFTFLSPKHKLDLFDKLIAPILNYSCEVWGFNQAQNIERVHLQFCKKVLGVKKNTQNDFVYGELGRTSFITHRYLIIIKYWLKVLKMSDVKYVKIVYNMMLSDFESTPNKINWASLVKHLLASLGFNYVWLQQEIGNDKYFLEVVKQRLTDNFIQN